MRRIGYAGISFQASVIRKKIPFEATGRKEVDITNLDNASDFVRVKKLPMLSIAPLIRTLTRRKRSKSRPTWRMQSGPYNLGIAGRRHGARVLHFSTDYVFDGKEGTPYSEEHSCTPVGAYGMSKLAGEIKLMDEHPHACVVRTSWLFGYPGRNFVDTMLRLMSEKNELKVVLDQVGRPTYCQDLAEAALDLLDEEGLFHFANGFETSWYEFAKEIHRQAAELGFPLAMKKIEPITTKEYPTPAKRPSYSTLSTKKIEGHLGRAPRVWQEALNDYLVKMKKDQKMQPVA